MTLNSKMEDLIRNNGLNVSLDLKNVSKNGFSLVASLFNIPFKSYIFDSKRGGTNRGFEILKAGMTSWAVNDLSYADEININYSMQGSGRYFVHETQKIVSNLYERLDCEKFKSPNILFSRDSIRLSPLENISSNRIFLGKSGGKDSSLVEKLLHLEKRFEVDSFKIDYDSKLYNDYRTREIIHNFDLFQLTSSLCQIHKKSSFIPYLEPNDFGITILAPFFNSEEYFPSNIAFGLQWDTQWRFEELNSSIVPLESEDSIRAHEILLREMGIKKAKIILPIASIHPDAVYTALIKLNSIGTVENMNSCWESSSHNCGQCPKCQRVYNILSNLEEDFHFNLPLIEMDPVYLYGSIPAGKVKQKYPEIPWGRGVIIGRHSDEPYINILGKILDGVQVHEKNLEITSEFSIDNSTEKTVRDIEEKLYINYSSLLDIPVNFYPHPFMPFEKYYFSNRKHKVLNCYGEIPVFNGHKFEYKHISKGPRLTVPDTEVMRNFFMENRQ